MLRRNALQRVREAATGEIVIETGNVIHGNTTDDCSNMASTIDNETKQSEKRKAHLFWTTLSVLSVFLLVIFIAAIAFPAPALRHVFSRIEAQTGIAVTFDGAYFYLANGSFLYIRGLTIRRQDHPVDNFDLRAESVRIPAMFPADFLSPVLLVSGLRGTYERVGSTPTNNGKAYISTLALFDSEVDFIDRTLERPFLTTIQLENFHVHKTNASVLFGSFIVGGTGKIDSAKFVITHEEFGVPMQQMGFTGVPIDLWTPYIPVLEDIFISGSMNIRVTELSGAIHKRLRVNIWLLPDCRIKPAGEILDPAIQAALNKLDESSIPALHDLQGKIESLKAFAKSQRTRLDEIARIIDTLSLLVPRDIRQEYERFKSQYDQTMAAYVEWNAKFESLLRDLERVKVGVVEETFQRFVDSGAPIEIELQEVDGKWQYDGYDVVARLIERNYHTIIAVEYQKHIQEILDAVDRLLMP